MNTNMHGKYMPYSDIESLGNYQLVQGGGYDILDIDNDLEISQYDAEQSYERYATTNNIGSIVITDKCRSIGVRAFSDALAHTSKGYFSSVTVNFTFASSLKTIEKDAFHSWKNNIQELILPNGLTTIGDTAFSYWVMNNEQLTIPNTVTSIGAFAFGNWNGNNKPLTIPNSITTISDGAFAVWSGNDAQLTIPNSVTTIGDSAFTNWHINSKSVILPSNLEYIGDKAFNLWYSTSYQLIIPSTVTYIGDQAFGEWRTNPNDIVFLGSTPPTIGDRVFFGWQQQAEPSPLNYKVIIQVPVGSNLSDWKSALTNSDGSTDVYSINGVLWNNI